MFSKTVASVFYLLAAFALLANAAVVDNEKRQSEHILRETVADM